MRYRSSSRLSYRNMLIAAGLAAALGVGTTYAQPGTAAQPHGDGQRDGQTPDGSADGSAASPFRAGEPAVPAAPANIMPRGSRR